MAKFKSLFGSKKGADTDGQEEYFREDFPPVANKSGGKKVEKKPTQTKKAEVKAEPKKATAKPAAKSEPKKATAPAKKTAAKPDAKKADPAKKATAAKAESKKAAASAKPAAKKAAPATKKATAAAKKTDTKPKKVAVSKELYDDSPEVKGAVAVQEGGGKWDIKRAKDGRFFFCLYASNHTVIAYSQIYSSLTAVTTGINSVIANAAKAETEDTTLKKSVSLPCPKWEIYLDKAEQYRFRLYAPNGLCICHSSHGYATKGGCKGGIESIKRFASEEAKVNKTYLK